jgi:hypothetical protein
MALLMGAVMAIIMLGYMLNMYKSRTVVDDLVGQLADAGIFDARAPNARRSPR